MTVRQRWLIFGVYQACAMLALALWWGDGRRQAQRAKEVELRLPSEIDLEVEKLRTVPLADLPPMISIEGGAVPLIDNVSIPMVQIPIKHETKRRLVVDYFVYATGEDEALTTCAGSIYIVLSNEGPKEPYGGVETAEVRDLAPQVFASNVGKSAAAVPDSLRVSLLISTEPRAGIWVRIQADSSIVNATLRAQYGAYWVGEPEVLHVKKAGAK